MTSTVQSFARLSDDELLATLKRLALTERRATAALVRSLMELDVRRLYLGEGHSSLFTYCTLALHLAEGAAYNRIEAARAARRFPVVLAALEEGSLTLTAVRLLVARQRRPTSNFGAGRTTHTRRPCSLSWSASMWWKSQ